MKNNRSATGLIEEPVVESEAPTGDDGASAEGLGKLQKMIQKVEGNLIRRIATLETSLHKINSLEDELVNVKLDLARALQPKEPYITNEDVDKWNKNCKKTQELEKFKFVLDYKIREPKRDIAPRGMEISRLSKETREMDK